jgi:tripartite-type tricarboxylate transporter receptor subunit TctC
MNAGRICVLLFAVAAQGVAAQGYPVKPIRVLAPSSGGTADIVARALAQGLTTALGQQVIIDNRNNDMTPIDVLLRAQPDGYTLTLYGTMVWLMPFMRSDLHYDPLKDLIPISMTNSAPTVLVTPANFQAKTVQELIALAKSKPGALNYATTATGNATHIAGELFKSMAHVDIVRVNYRLTTGALTDVISGQVQMMFGTAGAVTPHVKSGRMNALAVSSARPSALMPGLPTVAASGLPGYESLQMNGVFAPAKTPPAVIARLSREIMGFLSEPATKERFLVIGVEAVGDTPAEFVAAIKADMARTGKVIRDVGIHAD